jgi:two-component system, OmpR family, response regulator
MDEVKNPTRPPTTPRQLLVVDDNRDAAMTLAMLLRYAGHQVKVAFSGPEALTIAQEQQPSVILLDLAMPGMDGFQVAQALRQRPEMKNALIIAVSGYGNADDQERCQAAGFNLHLLKPVKREQVLEIIRSMPG